MGHRRACDPTSGREGRRTVAGGQRGRARLRPRPRRFCPGGLLEVPYAALTPRRDDTANLLSPVCASLTHIAQATYRLEPQYAVFGHSAGAAAALALRASASPVVQDVDVPALRQLLSAQGQLLSAGQPPAPPAPAAGEYGCATQLQRCVGLAAGGAYHNATCAGACAALARVEWLAHDCCGLWREEGGTLVALKDTWLKKSTRDSSFLPQQQKMAVSAGARCDLVGDATVRFDGYALCTPH